MEAAEGAIEAINGRLDGLDEEQDAQDQAIQAAQAAADKAQEEVDAVEVRMEAAEGAIVANKEHCDNAMAQEVIDRNAAIAAALEPYSTTEEVKGILGNVVSTLNLSMENDKMVLKLGGAEGITLSETSLDMATDADIDAIIAELDEE
jgi:chromosome segregation ATPase